MTVGRGQRDGLHGRSILAPLRMAAAVILTALVLGGCAATIARKAVPEKLENRAEVVGLAGKKIRVWGDEAIKDFAARARVLQKQRLASGLASANEDVLVLSGGGANGAFGAGLLNGWSRAGTRPSFTVVTGVSTGALIAPFAFLGPKYDPVLKEIYTRYSTKDLLTTNVLAGLFGGTAVTNSEPLAQLIAKYIDRKTLRKIAAQHARGRRLLIGTTNLDAERPVIWDMGRIAMANSKRSLRLFRRILLASASIPGVFPPVLIKVKVNGKLRREMHVDGGTTDNVVLLPVQTNIRSIARSPIRRQIYIVANLKLEPDWKNVKTSTVDIASRSIATLIKQATLGDIDKLYQFARSNGIGFKLASIPASFKRTPKEAFDRKYMTALYDLGFKLGRRGYRWRRSPPNL